MQLDLIPQPASTDTPPEQWPGQRIYWLDAKSASHNASWLCARTVVRVESIQRITYTASAKPKRAPHHPIIHLVNEHGYVATMEYNPSKKQPIPKTEALRIIDEVMIRDEWAGKSNAERYEALRQEIAEADSPILWR